MNPEPPFVQVSMDAQGELQVTSNVELKTAILGMLDHAKFLIVLGKGHTASDILKANGNPMTDRILKAQGS